MQEMKEMWVWSLGWEDPLEKEMATYSSIPAWKIPRTEEPGGLQLMGLRARAHTHTHTHTPTHTHTQRTLISAISKQFSKEAGLDISKKQSYHSPVTLLNLDMEGTLPSFLGICFCCLLPKTQDRIWEFAQFNRAWTGRSLSWRQNSHMWGSSIWILVEINKMSRDFKKKKRQQILL